MRHALLLVINLKSRKWSLILDISMITLLHGVVSKSVMIHQWSFTRDQNKSFKFQLEFDLQGDILVLDLDTTMQREGCLQRLRKTQFPFYVREYCSFRVLHWLRLMGQWVTNCECRQQHSPIMMIGHARRLFLNLIWYLTSVWPHYFNKLFS